jgi:hypothetical protein
LLKSKALLIAARLEGVGGGRAVYIFFLIADNLQLISVVHTSLILLLPVL